MKIPHVKILITLAIAAMISILAAGASALYYTKVKRDVCKSDANLKKDGHNVIPDIKPDKPLDLSLLKHDEVVDAPPITPRVEPVIRNLELSARSAVIMDAESGCILYAKNADLRLLPASTAKVMTVIVALENRDLDSLIKASPNVKRVETTRVGLTPGAEYKLRDLVLAALINSANDAAITIAEGISGSEEAFAELMTEKAKKLGMFNTEFTTASGLPQKPKDTQYTTAYDLAVMMRYVTRNAFILETMSQRFGVIQGSDGKKIYLRTHNRTVRRNSDVVWGKTGYTRRAKKTFVGCDASLKPKIVFAMMKSDNLWVDVKKLKCAGLAACKNR
ncbi:MAG: D-alanyl-D-alanine carboxypeptidase [Candidatus Omnitrophica bacterium]|nr:D-alanyl-D-alanine carboxypeptidase [Candidatus Omnitrophota bacterium]